MSALRSIRVRLTLWYAVAMAVMLSFFSLGVYGFVELRLRELLTERLRTQYAALEQSLGDEPESEHQEELTELDQVGMAEAFVIRRDGELIYSSHAWPLSPKKSNTWLETPHSPLPIELQNYNTQRGGLEKDGHRYDIVVAVSDAERQATLHSLAAILLIGWPIAFLLAVGGGWWLASRALQPVTRIVAQARQITADRLAERLPVDNPHDEIGALAIVFNEVLARLEDAFERVRSFAADASHELRTPLTALRSVGEVALQDRDNPSAAREAVGSMLEETDRLVNLLDNLLVLTRADADRTVVRREACGLGELVREVVELIGVLAEEKQQLLTVDAPPGMTVWADATLVRQAVLNVLDNAIKFTPQGGRVEVVVSRTATAGVVAIHDSGPGVAEEHRAHIFERFYRADSVRATQRGSGLGLPIAQWAASACGGSIELDTQLGAGSTFRLLFPACKGEQA